MSVRITGAELQIEPLAIAPIPEDHFTPYPDVDSTRADQLAADLANLGLENFAERFFRERIESGKRRLSKTETSRYQPTPLTAPLLTATPKASTKPALETFRQILAYATPGRPTTGSAETALALANAITADPA
jgi:hypothetical protein